MMIKNKKFLIALFLVIGIIAGILFSKTYLSSTPSPASAKVLNEYKGDVAKVIRENAADLQKCYLEHLAMNPKRDEGKVSFVFQVEEDGRVSSMDVTGNELESETIKSCVSQKISSYRFPPPPVGVNRYISHTILFESPESAASRRNKRFPKILPQSPE